MSLHFLTDVEIVKTQQPPGCIVDPAFRKECGFTGIGEAECHGRGCCYDSSIPDALHCFLTPACAIDAILRVECGFDGITMDECLETGCCWEDNPDAPRYCYQQASKGQSDQLVYILKFILRSPSS